MVKQKEVKDEQPEEVLLDRRELAFNVFKQHIFKGGTQGTNILDVGCENNWLRDKVESLGFTWIGLDMCKADGILIKGRIEDLPIHDSTVHIVYASHIFEHTREPFKVLSEFKRVLNASGILFMVTPSPTYQQLFTINKQHCFVLNPDQLTVILRKGGFQIMKQEVLKDEHGDENIITICVAM